MRKLLLLIAVVSALCTCAGALVAGPATAAGLTPPVADCVKNQALTQNYPASELRNALATMPADLSEYSNCYAIIQHALEAKIGKLSLGSGSGGGSFLPTWLLILLIVLVLGGAGFAGVAIRRSRGDG
jgi:hypothetical protein